MKKWIIVGSFTALLALVGMVSLGAFAFAQSPILGRPDFGFRGGPHGGEGEFFDRGGPGEGFVAHPGGPGHRRGPGGEVTAINTDSLTLETRTGDSLVVNLSDETSVFLVESNAQGNVSDIQVGDKVGVRGSRNDDGTVDAEEIMVAPRGDVTGGRVTVVNDANISVENPRDGTVTIITNDDTQFRRGRDGEATLNDVTPDEFVMAVGQLQDDGSLSARLVVVGVPPRGPDGPGHPRGPRDGAYIGQVSSVEDTSFVLETFWEEALVTVLTDDNTVYYTRGDGEVSFEDITVGTNVLVKGQPVGDESNTIRATAIGIKK